MSDFKRGDRVRYIGKDLNLLDILSGKELEVLNEDGQGFVDVGRIGNKADGPSSAFCIPEATLEKSTGPEKDPIEEEYKPSPPIPVQEQEEVQRQSLHLKNLSILVSLKSNGFSADEIVTLHKGGLL